jgi:hypothetical protein
MRQNKSQQPLQIQNITAARRHVDPDLERLRPRLAQSHRRASSEEDVDEGLEAAECDCNGLLLEDQPEELGAQLPAA